MEVMRLASTALLTLIHVAAGFRHGQGKRFGTRIKGNSLRESGCEYQIRVRGSRTWAIHWQSKRPSVPTDSRANSGLYLMPVKGFT